MSAANREIRLVSSFNLTENNYRTVFALLCFRFVNPHTANHPNKYVQHPAYNQTSSRDILTVAWCPADKKKKKKKNDTRTGAQRCRSVAVWSESRLTTSRSDEAGGVDMTKKRPRQ